MALVNAADKSHTSSLVAYKEKSPKGNMGRPMKILDEETYTEEMEKIITRDFFPHVNKLKAQLDYLEALDSGDMAKLNEIQLAFKPRSMLNQCCSSLRDSIYTPSAFGTPDVFPNSSPNCENEAEPVNDEQDENVSDFVITDKMQSQPDKRMKSLDEFLAGATSEDNASFEEIREKDAILHQQKYPWLYKNENAEEEKVKKMLALQPAEDLSKEISKGVPITWTYKNRNALMYVPDGVDYTAEEKLQLEKQQGVQYNNTRFAAPPFDEKANKEAIAEAASYQAKMKEGKVGIDGKEIVTDDSPKVNGYGFIGTPSPAPGISDTPIMTWGEIEGTPFRLDGSDTPLPQNPGGQQFKMPEIPARERIALSLADKVAKKKRQKKKDALKHAQSSWLTPSPKFGSSTPLTPSERLQSMSPAAQRLASGIHRSMDKALRASYTPSPIHSPHRERTPDVEQVASVAKTPVESPYKKTKISLSAENITQFSRRQRAQDFF